MEDSHSSLAQEWMNGPPRALFTPLHFAECSHAIARQVFYRKISPAEAERIVDLVIRDRSSLWIEVAIPENAFELCADLARQYGPTIGMRTLDTLHVACALELKAERFWTFDERQKKLARARGLETDGPIRSDQG